VANPQGKGLRPILNDLQGYLAVSAPAKPLLQITNELFTSLFILNSQFSFRPVPGKAYYLYKEGTGFNLSLIAPKEWSKEKQAAFVGTSQLNQDLTWTLNLSEQCEEDEAFMEKLTQMRQKFEKQMDAAASLQDVLPTYEKSLKFHQRILAFGLSHSLGQSMGQSGVANLSYKEALQLTHNTEEDQ